MSMLCFFDVFVPVVLGVLGFVVVSVVFCLLCLGELCLEFCVVMRDFYVMYSLDWVLLLVCVLFCHGFLLVLGCLF